jgi:hypothetical protein
VLDFSSQSAVVIPKCNKWMSFKANIIIEIRDFSSNPDQLLQKEFHWNIVRSIHSFQHSEGNIFI